MAETTEKRRPKTIIILLAIIVILISLLGFFLITDINISDIFEMFNFRGDIEDTLLLEEFVVNLNSEGNGRSFLKMTIALMYTEKEHGELLSNNTSKLRDIIISDLRSKTVEDLIDEKSINGLKEEILTDINTKLGEEIVKDIYINDIVIQ